MLFPLISSFFRSIYLPSTIPAGHSIPPQPFVRSSRSLSGGASKPSKSTSATPALFCAAGGTRSWLTLKRPFSASLSDDIVGGAGFFFFHFGGGRWRKGVVYACVLCVCEWLSFFWWSMAASVGYMMVAAAAGSGCGGCWWGLARSRVPVTRLPTWAD
jgi:hypothetical protein